MTGIGPALRIKDMIERGDFNEIRSRTGNQMDAVGHAAARTMEALMAASSWIVVWPMLNSSAAVS